MDTDLLTFMANAGVNDERAQASAVQLSEKVKNKTLRLLDIIVSLKDYIVSEDGGERKKSLQCLNGIIAHLPKDGLSKNEIAVLFQFFQSKIDDTELMREVLTALELLSSFNFFVVQQAKETLQTLQDKYVPTNFLAAVRYVAFNILVTLYGRFENQLKENESLAHLFIATYIHVATGEKDPRNLLSSFKLNETITKHLSQYTVKYGEQLFDVLFCYFPITFKPPKNDPYKITNADLKTALRSAISATPLFAEDAFGNLIDKLTATSPAVKNDTLLTMAACIESYGGENCLKHWLPLWNGLKFEIMQNNDDGDDTMLDPVSNLSIKGEIKSNYRAALDVLKALGVVLEQFDQKAFQKYFDHILDELKNNFKYQKDLKQSCNILASIASGNEYNFNYAIAGSFPLFVESSSETTKLKYLLMNLSFFFNAYMEVYGVLSKESLNSEICQNKMQEYKDELLMIIGMALTSSSKLEVTVRTLSVIKFTQMAKMKGFLKREEISLIVQYITDTILTDSNKNIYYACLEGLKSISELYEDIVYEVALTRMLNLLPEALDEASIAHDETMILAETLLKIILDFTTSRHILVKESILSLTKKLCKTSASIARRSSDYCFLILSTIYSLYDNNYFLLKEGDGALLKHEIENDLYAVLADGVNVKDDDLNLSLISNIFYFMHLCNGTTGAATEVEKASQYFIDQHSITKQPNRLSMTYSKIIQALTKEIQFPQADQILSEVKCLLSGFDSTMTEFEKLGYFEILLALSNKWLDDDYILSILNWEDRSYCNLEVMIWLSKGLIAKNSKYSDDILQNFIAMLSDHVIGTKVSKLFEVFVIDFTSFKKYKGIAWNNNIKLLYKQRTFSGIFLKLVSLYQTSNNMDIKCNYLTALSLILKHTPSELVSPFMKDLLPMLLQALDMPNSEVRLSALETLKDSTEQHHQLVAEHIQSLVPSLLSLVKVDEYNTVMIRLSALQLLQLLTEHLPINYCLNYKQDIINGLLEPLSDKKRVVRKQCIDTRQAYFELGQVPFE
ncbi:DNA repair/transcription protein MET18/MMS19 [Nakaseomyces glabratus]|nr:DNA repair/transcription protein MET18/MMS19 [Nakaseomyces glabratus]KTB24479.1 DNA repair/transcription protein MET18/MMS19 [Nakaseomyces glabratus]